MLIRNIRFVKAGKNKVKLGVEALLTNKRTVVIENISITDVFELCNDVLPEDKEQAKFIERLKISHKIYDETEVSEYFGNKYSGFPSSVKKYKEYIKEKE